MTALRAETWDDLPSVLPAPPATSEPARRETRTPVDVAYALRTTMTALRLELEDLVHSTPLPDGVVLVVERSMAAIDLLDRDVEEVVRTAGPTVDRRAVAARVEAAPAGAARWPGWGDTPASRR